MNHDEFLAVVEKCRAQRGALTTIRAAASVMVRPPLAFAQLEKFLQDWSKPVTIDRAVRLAIQVLDYEDLASPNVAQAKELLSALLLATGERAAEHERRSKGDDGKTTP